MSQTMLGDILELQTQVAELRVKLAAALERIDALEAAATAPAEKERRRA